MKRKSMLLKGIAEEAAEKERLENQTIKAQQELARLDKEKEVRAQQKKAHPEVDELVVPETRVRYVEEKPIVRRSNPLKILLDFIVKLLTLIFNLIMTLIESLQWIVVSVVLTIAVIIILKYSGVDVNTLIDNGKSLLFKK